MKNVFNAYRSIQIDVQTCEKQNSKQTFIVEPYNSPLKLFASYVLTSSGSLSSLAT